MYIKCDTVDQLEEVMKYYNNIESYISAVNMFKWYDNKEPICISENGDFGRLNYFKSLNVDIITFSQWQLQTLRDLGFDTELANDMLSRCDKFKRNDMNKKDQFIQLEGGKLNITKARELGLWVEDKKVFTINETNEIQYNEYKIKSTVNTFWKRVVRIFKNDELIVKLINPTPDKLRSEFAYYGIEVEVV